MVDDIVDGGKDVPIEAAFKKALGDQNGTAIFQTVMRNNPTFTPNTTRLQVRSNPSLGSPAHTDWTGF